MGQASFLQASFAGGEWSKAAAGNLEDPRYKTAMARCYNGIPVEPGSWVRRPGTQLSTGGFTKGGAQARLIDWSFKENIPTTMEFTAGNVRFHSGPRLVTTNDAQTVSAISAANPAVVTTGAAHGWTTNDEVYFSVLGTVDPLLLARRFTITVTDTNKFSLADAVTGDSVDGSTLAAFTSGTIVRVADLPVSYTADQLANLRSVQAEKQSVLLHPAQKIKIITATPPDGADDPEFEIETAQLMDGPYLDPVVGASLTPASTSGIVGFTMASPTYSGTTAYNRGDYVVSSSVVYKSLIDQNVGNTPASSAFAWLAVDQDEVMGGLQASDIGRHIRLFSEPSAWDVAHTYSARDNVKYNGQYWTAVSGTNTGNQPGLDTTKWALNPRAAQWTWGRITSLTGAAATLIDRTAGTAFGVLNPVNISDAFDGITASVAADCCILDGNNGDQTDLSIGKNYGGSPKSVSYALVYGSSDRGWVLWRPNTAPDQGTLTFNLRGKSSAPSGPSDGTLLGTVANVTNATSGVVQILSNDSSTTYQYLWVEIVVNRTQPQNNFGIGKAYVAELQFYTASPFSGTGLSAQIMGPALLYTTAINTWRLGLFSDANPYPACGTYHEGRLWLMGAVDNRLDAGALVDINGNRAPTLFYFTPTLYDGTVSDACAISYPLDGPDVNAAYWLEPIREGIRVGTQAGEWLIQATNNNNVLTPTSIQAHRVTKIGCANIEPCHTPLTTIFVQRLKRFVQEYFAEVFSGRFTSPELSEDARHLTSPSIEEIRFQTNVSPVIWARRGDGVLVGSSYRRDSLVSSQGPKNNGWHQHALGHGRTVESITVGASPSTPSLDVGASDTLALVTKDADTGFYYVEFMTKIPEETDDAEDAWHVDGAVIATTTQGVSSGGSNGMKVDGLWPLNGKTVAVVCGGYDCGDFLVANGSFFVPYTTPFTQAFATAAAQTIVGFTFTSEGQLLPPDLPQQGGARTGPGFGKVRRVSEFAAALINTGVGIKFGTDFTRLKTAQLRSPGGSTVIAAPNLYTGTYKDTVDDAAMSLASQLCWRITRPYPALISSIGGFVQTQD